MSSHRVIGWDVKFQQLIAARRKSPFAWHDNDCASFGADNVLAVTGADLFADYRGRYSDAAGAAAFISAAGSLRALWPLPTKPKGFAKRADLGIAMLDGRETTVVVLGNGFWCAPGPDGLVFRPMSEVFEVMTV